MEFAYVVKFRALIRALLEEAEKYQVTNHAGQTWTLIKRKTNESNEQEARTAE